jgi:hypothetical protein
VPMSTNIKEFRGIRLRFDFKIYKFGLIHSWFSWFDQTVSRLLEEFRRNSLLTNVNIYLHSVVCNPNVLFTFLRDIVPLTTSINLVDLNLLHDRVAMGLFKGEYSKLAKPLFQSARVLICTWGFLNITSQINMYSICYG